MPTDCLTSRARRPRSFRFPEAFRRCQAARDCEPALRMPKVRDLKPATLGHRHPRVSQHDVVLGTPTAYPVTRAQIERLSAPLGKDRDTVVEWAGISGSHLEQSRELPGQPLLRPAIDLLASRSAPWREPITSPGLLGCLRGLCFLHLYCRPCESSSRGSVPGD